MGTVKVMISVPKPLLEAVDRVATEEHRSRSEWFREAARRYLGEHVAHRRPLDDPHVRQAVALMEQLAANDRHTPGWDTVDAVRRERQRDGGE
jgi:metal-responsive CopG/Arc/MetJ family transcriptional regulator